MAAAEDKLKYDREHRPGLMAKLEQHPERDIMHGCLRHCDEYSPKGDSFAHGIINDHLSGKHKVKNPVSFAAELAQRSGLKA